MAPQGRATQQPRDTRKTKQSIQPPFTSKMIAKLERTQSNTTKHRTITDDPD